MEHYSRNSLILEVGFYWDDTGDWSLSAAQLMSNTAMNTDADLLGTRLA